MSKLKGSVDMPEEFKFADSGTFYTMLRNIFRGKSILVTGPSGCGKSSLGKILADITNKPYYAFNFGDTMNPAAKILGDTKYDASVGTLFKPSRFVQALSDEKGAFIMMDEVTRDRTGDLANMLMPVLDGQKYLALDESDDATMIQIDPSAFFYATANIGREYLGAAHKKPSVTGCTACVCKCIAGSALQYSMVLHYKGIQHYKGIPYCIWEVIL